MLTSVIAIAQESGMYRNNANQNELNVVVGDRAVEITGWNFTISFPKNTDGKYVSEYGSVLEGAKDRSITITGKTGMVEAFSLYAPLTYKLPEGVRF